MSNLCVLWMAFWLFDWARFSCTLPGQGISEGQEGLQWRTIDLRHRETRQKIGRRGGVGPRELAPLTNLTPQELGSERGKKKRNSVVESHRYTKGISINSFPLLVSRSHVVRISLLGIEQQSVASSKVF